MKTFKQFIKEDGGHIHPITAILGLAGTFAGGSLAAKIIGHHYKKYVAKKQAAKKAATAKRDAELAHFDKNIAPGIDPKMKTMKGPKPMRQPVRDE
jgi:hypothetical protein